MLVCVAMEFITTGIYRSIECLYIRRAKVAVGTCVCVRGDMYVCCTGGTSTVVCKGRE